MACSTSKIKYKEKLKFSHELMSVVSSYTNLEMLMQFLTVHTESDKSMDS